MTMPTRTAGMSDGEYVEELRRSLFEMQHQYRVAFKIQAAPIIAELVRLTGAKPPANTIVGPDGLAYNFGDRPNA